MSATIKATTENEGRLYLKVATHKWEPIPMWPNLVNVLPTKASEAPLAVSTEPTMFAQHCLHEAQVKVLCSPLFTNTSALLDFSPGKCTRNTHMSSTR